MEFKHVVKVDQYPIVVVGAFSAEATEKLNTIYGSMIKLKLESASIKQEELGVKIIIIDDDGDITTHHGAITINAHGDAGIMYPFEDLDDGGTYDEFVALLTSAGKPFSDAPVEINTDNLATRILDSTDVSLVEKLLKA